MTKETLEKAKFVKNELSTLLKKVDPAIERAWYNVSENATSEYVTIRYVSGREITMPFNHLKIAYLLYKE